MNVNLINGSSAKQMRNVIAREERPLPAGQTGKQFPLSFPICGIAPPDKSRASNDVYFFFIRSLTKIRYSIFLTGCVILLLTEISSLAQLKLYPVKRQSTTVIKNKKSSARIQSIEPLMLPFWDDFSSTPGDYPDTLRWENSKSVWVNDGMGINPPTIRVATFDGLDSTGLPYNPNEILVNGFTDKLTSQKINLDTIPTGPLRNTVYLSFFFQWFGNGEPPDPTDFLQVDFLDSTGRWIPAMTIQNEGNFNHAVFYDTIVQVRGGLFFHDGFQFRFRSFGRESGPFDTWNIDYVYLNKNRNVSDLSYPDQSVSSPLTSLFGDYRSVPIKHFFTNKQLTHPKFDIYNLTETDDLNYLTEGTFINYKELTIDTTFISNLGITDTSAINDDGSGIIFTNERRQVTLEYIPDPTDGSQFDTLSNSILIKLKTRLFTGDVVDPKNGGPANDYTPNYIPIDFRSNDTVSAIFTLDKYYAYDDGTAEYAVGLTQSGNRAVYQFEMLTPEPDTLVGFDIYFPDHALGNNQTIDLLLYKDKGNKPDSLPLFVLTNLPISRKGLNKFTPVRFEPSVLVKDKFYIGWKAPASGKPQVGLDKSNDTGNKIFVNTNGSWLQNDDIHGSLMIRPLFGAGTVISGLQEEKKNLYAIYPNPNSGKFYIRGHYDHLQIITVTGQPIEFHTDDIGDEKKISIPQAASGLYLLRLNKGTIFETQKIIIR